jgi:uncharacterized protein (TIGR03435 family)
MFGQTTPKPRFEVASIKPATRRVQPPTRGGPGTADPGQIVYANQSLRDLIFQAYRAMPYQLIAPSWMDEGERFDIVANVPAGADKAAVPLMLEALLEERFHVEVSHEFREAQAYLLTVAKGGAKIKQYEAALPANFIEAPRISGVDEDGVPIVSTGYVATMLGSNEGQTFIVMAREPIGSLCSFLSRVLKQPVVDGTGLAGRYDARLLFAAEPGGTPPSSEDTQSEASSPAPALREAVRKQLGLQLEPKKLSVDFLVVKQADKRPTEN